MSVQCGIKMGAGQLQVNTAMGTEDVIILR